MKIVTAEGQIKKRDRLQIVGKSTLDDQIATVKEVIIVNGKEEIIIDKKKNRYFITSVLLDGRSWAKQVCIFNNPHIGKVFKVGVIMSQLVIQSFVTNNGDLNGRFFKLSTSWRQYLCDLELVWGHETIIFEGEKDGINISYKKIVYTGDQNFYGHHQLILGIYERGIVETLKRLNHS